METTTETIYRKLRELEDGINRDDFCIDNLLHKVKEILYEFYHERVELLEEGMRIIGE